jgi:hypothetical protein
MKQKSIAFLFGLFFLPALFAKTDGSVNCTCSSRYWTTTGWVTTEWHYSTNTSSCFPAQGTVYNFGFAYTYKEGVYLGTTFYDGSTNNINNSMNCPIA